MYTTWTLKPIRMKKSVYTDEPFYNEVIVYDADGYPFTLISNETFLTHNTDNDNEIYRLLREGKEVIVSVHIWQR